MPSAMMLSLTPILNQMSPPPLSQVCDKVHYKKMSSIYLPPRRRASVGAPTLRTKHTQQQCVDMAHCLRIKTGCQLQNLQKDILHACENCFLCAPNSGFPTVTITTAKSPHTTEQSKIRQYDKPTCSNSQETISRLDVFTHYYSTAIGVQRHQLEFFLSRFVFPLVYVLLEHWKQIIL